MVQRSEVITVAEEAATNRLVSVLSTLEPARRHSKIYNLSQKELLYGKLKICSLKSAVCVLHDCLHHTFLGGELPELLLSVYSGSPHYLLIVCDKKTIRKR